MEQPKAVARRKLLRLVRRAGIVASVALIILAVVLFSSITVSVTPANGGTDELLNGRADSSTLLLPLGLFALGIAGLAACLRW